MSLMTTNLSANKAPYFDKNVIKWSGYFHTTEQAHAHLMDQVTKFAHAEGKTVIACKKDLVNRHFKGLFLYRFTIALSETQ